MRRYKHMITHNKALKRIIAVFCVIFILACASIVFLPHQHECLDTECVVCTMLETSRDMLTGLAPFVAVYPTTIITFVISGALLRILSVRDGTPVGLKVKLSD